MVAANFRPLTAEITDEVSQTIRKIKENQLTEEEVLRHLIAIEKMGQYSPTFDNYNRNRLFKKYVPDQVAKLKNQMIEKRKLERPMPTFGDLMNYKNFRMACQGKSLSECIEGDDWYRR